MLGKAIAVEVDGFEIERLNRKSGGYGLSHAAVFPPAQPRIAGSVV
jgi:hypothetical protein